MTPFILRFLCEPVTKEPLALGEIRLLVNALQPDDAKALNADKYFLRPPAVPMW